MKKEILKLIFFFLPVLALVLAINLYFDPGSIAGLNSQEERIANLMLEGKDIVLPKKLLNFAPEKVYEYYFNSPGEKSFDVISIGSSRSMPMHSGAFPGETFFNVSVGSCRIGDMLGLYRLIEKNNVKHKRVIIGLGPNLMMLPPPAFRTEVLNPYYFEMLDILGFNYEKPKEVSLKNKIKKYKELISPRYFQKSTKLFFTSFTEEPISATEDEVPTGINPPGGVIHRDGSKNWDKQLAERKGKEREKYIIDGTLMQIRTQMKPVIDPSSHAVLVTFVKYLQAKGIEVEFFLAPYHPIAHEIELRLRKGKTVTSEEVTESYLRQVAKELNIKVIGSHNPYKINLKDSEMVDHHHPTRGFMTRIFKESYSTGNSKR